MLATSRSPAVPLLSYADLLRSATASTSDCRHRHELNSRSWRTTARPNNGRPATDRPTPAALAASAEWPVLRRFPQKPCSPAHLPLKTIKQRFLSRRKRLHDLTWTLDDDLTPAQQQKRRDLWPEYLRHKQDPQKLKVYWRPGGDLTINHKMWSPPARPARINSPSLNQW
eukprot:jgi/Mesvir1/24384/Mv11053-RA.1